MKHYQAEGSFKGQNLFYIDQDRQHMGKDFIKSAISLAVTMIRDSFVDLSELCYRPISIWFSQGKYHVALVTIWMDYDPTFGKLIADVLLTARGKTIRLRSISRT